MHRPRFAEWLLAQQCGDQRASEIVGDLEEQYGPSGLNARIVATAFVMSRRSVAAIVFSAMIVASPGLCGFSGGLSRLVFWMVPLIQFLHLFRDFPGGQTWLTVLRVITALSWSVTLLCTLRYGLSDLMTRVGLALSFLLSVDTLLSFQPYARVTTSCFIAVSALALLFSRQRAAQALWSLLTMAATELIVLQGQLMSRVPPSFAFTWALHHRFLPHSQWTRGLVALLTLSDFIHWTVAAAVAAWIMTASRGWLGLTPQASPDRALPPYRDPEVTQHG